MFFRSIFGFGCSIIAIIIYEQFASIGAPLTTEFRTNAILTEINMVALVVVLVLAFWKGRSIYSMVEFALLILLSALQTRFQISFAVYWSLKLWISMLSSVFAFKAMKTLLKKDYDVAYYFFSFKSSWFHAGIVADNQFYHLRNAELRTDQKKKRDSVANVSPSTLHLKVEKEPIHHNANFEQPISYLRKTTKSNSFDEGLPASGKCHNWALHFLYNLSTEKFLSTAALFPVRWEGWIHGIISFSMLTITVIGKLPFTPMNRYLDLVLISIFILDSFNLDSAALKQARTLKEKNEESPWVEALLCGILIVLFLFVTYFFMDGPLLYCWPQIAIYVSSGAALVYLRVILPAFVLPDNAEEVYDLWDIEDLEREEKERAKELKAKKERLSHKLARKYRKFAGINAKH